MKLPIDHPANIRRESARTAALNLEHSTLRMERKLATRGFAARAYALSTDLVLALGCAVLTLAIAFAQVSTAHAKRGAASVLYIDSSDHLEWCDARIVVRKAPTGIVCEARIVGACEMTLAQCLESYAYVGESEEPTSVLGCANEPRPRVAVLDCSEL